MRIRVEVDRDMSLKRWKKVGQKTGDSFIVRFKYEKLHTFCFVWGILGHTENFCEVRFSSPEVEPKREWGLFLKALDRHGRLLTSSKWLGEMSDVGSVVGGNNSEIEFGKEASFDKYTGCDRGDNSNLSMGVYDPQAIVLVTQRLWPLNPDNSILNNPVYEDDAGSKILENDSIYVEEELKRKRGNILDPISQAEQHVKGNIQSTHQDTTSE
ncbi:hypothetical protein ACS0TY_004683 [Phlomoides rotata]